MTVSRIPVPSAPGRKGRTEEMRRDYEEQIKAREAATARRRELHSALVRFVHMNGGWVVSAPGQPLQIETRPDDDLIDKLIDRGFSVHAQGTRTRAEGGKLLPVCVHSLDLPPLR